MSRLYVYNQVSAGKSGARKADAVFDNGDEITAELSRQGTRFERWQAASVVKDSDSQQQVLAAYNDQVSRLMAEHGFKTADVINVHPGLDNLEAIRQKFLREHTHSEPEVRFFVHGRGLFYLHIEDSVYVVLCEKDDLLFVPAGTTHWFDMGISPDIKAIRLFSDEAGWVANYTGSDIADSFPYFDDLIESVHSP